MNYEEKKKNQILEAKKTIDLWENKLRFSLNSLFVFLSFMLIYLIDPIFGFIPALLFLMGFLFFTQQTIRSYNYLKFHRVTLKSLQIIHPLLSQPPFLSHPPFFPFLSKLFESSIYFFFKFFIKT